MNKKDRAFGLQKSPICALCVVSTGKDHIAFGMPAVDSGDVFRGLRRLRHERAAAGGERRQAECSGFAEQTE